MQSRSPRQEEVEIEVILPDGHKEILKVRQKNFPVAAYGIYLPIPGIIIDHTTSDIVSGHFLFRFHEGDVEKFLSRYSGISRIGEFDVTAFMRMLAKIAYAFAAAELKSNDFHPILRDLVLARAPNAAYLSYLVGGDGETAPTLKGNFTNRVEIWDHVINGATYTVVSIQLFGFMGMPKYQVVVRKRCHD